MKKTNFQVYIENRAALSGKTLDAQTCILLECSECIHRQSDQDTTDPLGCSNREG